MPDSLKREVAPGLGYGPPSFSGKGVLPQAPTLAIFWKCGGVLTRCSDPDALIAEDPRYAELEHMAAAQPTISVPSVILLPLADGFGVADVAPTLPLFVGGVEIDELPGVGHNAPQEAPDAFVKAVLSLRGPAVR